MNVQSAKDILTALVGYDTTSRNSNLDLIAWVEGYLDRHGVAHERIYDETAKKSNLRGVIGDNGNRLFKGTVRGGTCHSSLAPLGLNAGEDAARVIAKIRDIADRLATNGTRDELYDVPFTPGHPGYLHGGTALNIVPDV